jgi:hypothetical protein
VLTSGKGKSFKDAGSRIFQQETESQAGIVRLLGARAPTSVRDLPIAKVVANPEQPRMTFNEETLNELAASIREAALARVEAGRQGIHPGDRRALR